jgi:hypothetical protein
MRPPPDRLLELFKELGDGGSFLSGYNRLGRVPEYSKIGDTMPFSGFLGGAGIGS